MREILFRGKHICDNLWVYGSLFYSASEDQYYIVENDGEELSYQVREKTIGQYIGLKDKNGKKIFEGDIVEDILGEMGKIVYKEKYSAFVVAEWQCGYALWFKKEIEVIGNIYDNPELIKSEV